MFINISGRLMLINASIIIKRRKNKQIRIESMNDSLRIYLGNTSDEWERQRTIIREIAFAVCRAKGKAKPSQGKAGMRGVACGTPPPGMLRFVQPVPGSRYTMRRSSSWTMTCRLINFYNCMHSFQCGFEVVFTVNVHSLFYVFFISFIYSCFTHCAYLICL